MRPLENIEVIDFSTLLPGPLAGLMLAGAQVIKIEDKHRRRDARLRTRAQDSVNFALLNAGKESVTS